MCGAQIVLERARPEELQSSDSAEVLGDAAREDHLWQVRIAHLGVMSG